MTTRRWVAILLVLVGGAFGYGFIAGAYRLPPFFQIAWLKNTLLAKVTTPSEPTVPVATATSATILETGVQRLLLKRLTLPSVDDDYSGGGSLAAAGRLLYVVSTHGDVVAFDAATPSRVSVSIPRAPINRDTLMQSRLRYVINTFWFRSAGSYAEATDDSSQVLYVMHNRLDPARECITFVVSKIALRVRADGVSATGPWQSIFTTSPCMTMQHDKGAGRYPYSGHISGGKIIGFDERRLLVSVGDYEYDGWHRPQWAQDDSNPYGKIVLVDKQTGKWEVFARGARNDMGLHKDSAGTIWATESGPQGGDELNRITPSANYGWPKYTYGINYENTPWPPAEAQGRHDGATPPVFSWLPSVVPTNLVRISGHRGMFEPWRGDLVLGTLRDQALHHLRLTADGRIAYDERIPIGDRIRDLLRLPDGRLVMLTDATNHLIFADDGGPMWVPVDSATLKKLGSLDKLDVLVPSAPKRETGSGAASRDSLPSASDPSIEAGAPKRNSRLAAGSGEAVFAEKCSACHGRDGRIIVGPPLDGLMKRYVGSRAGFSYTEALKEDGRFWSPELLVTFLRNPAGTWPGTRMPKVPLSQPEIDSLVTLLSRAP